jgi:hypothetical protein
MKKTWNYLTEYFSYSFPKSVTGFTIFQCLEDINNQNQKYLLHVIQLLVQFSDKINSKTIKLL